MFNINLNVRRQFLQQCISWSDYHSNPYLGVIARFMLLMHRKVKSFKQMAFLDSRVASHLIIIFIHQ